MSPNFSDILLAQARRDRRRRAMDSVLACLDEAEFSDLPVVLGRNLAEAEREQLLIALFKSLPPDVAFLAADSALRPVAKMPTLETEGDDSFLLRCADEWAKATSQADLRAHFIAIVRRMNPTTRRDALLWACDKLEPKDKKGEAA